MIPPIWLAGIIAIGCTILGAIVIGRFVSHKTGRWWIGLVGAIAFLVLMDRMVFPAFLMD